MARTALATGTGVGIISPGGAAVDSQGRQPLVGAVEQTIEAPEGRQIRRVAPPGLKTISLVPGIQGLTPLAIDCRPSGANDRRLCGAALIAVGIFFLLCHPASAQTSFPMITHATPVAVQRGQTAEVVVEGQMN